MSILEEIRRIEEHNRIIKQKFELFNKTIIGRICITIEREDYQYLGYIIKEYIKNTEDFKEELKMMYYRLLIY